VISDLVLVSLAASEDWGASLDESGFNVQARCACCLPQAEANLVGG